MFLLFKKKGLLKRKKHLYTIYFKGYVRWVKKMLFKFSLFIIQSIYGFQNKRVGKPKMVPSKQFMTMHLTWEKIGTPIWTGEVMIFVVVVAVLRNTNIKTVRYLEIAVIIFELIFYSLTSQYRDEGSVEARRLLSQCSVALYFTSLAMFCTDTIPTHKYCIHYEYVP